MANQREGWTDPTALQKYEELGRQLAALLSEHAKFVKKLRAKPPEKLSARERERLMWVTREINETDKARRALEREYKLTMGRIARLFTGEK